MLNRLNKLREERTEGDNGFTLIELLVVVVIIGILIAIAIPLYLNYQKGANDKSAQSDLRGAVSVLEQCNSDNSSYPATAEVSASGGAVTGTCSSQTINLSKNTTIKYTSTGTSYIIASTNSGGSKFYCYNSLKGGAVTSVAAASLAAATC
ncbi:MAG TPA: prepilin-type N-terminal cleavage/methylation domain-containing protein [Jatrophihabitans sp.]|jgi:type IV pilus assembly protein PilA